MYLAHSVAQCWLQLLQFLLHLINLLSILLGCNAFTVIQKAVVDQRGSRPSYSDHDHFLWNKFGFGKCFGASSQSHTELVIAGWAICVADIASCLYHFMTRFELEFKKKIHSNLLFV